MKHTTRLLRVLLAGCMVFNLLALSASALSFTDAHGQTVELDETLEAHTAAALVGGEDAARRGETALGDLWTDALRWFAVSGKINGYFDEDDVAAGNSALAVDADHVVALWNGGNLRADIPAGKFGAEALAKVLPYPNKVAVIYMTGAQLREALEAASQGLPYTAATADACAALMQVSGLKYTVNMDTPYDAGEAYGKSWFKAASVGRVSISEVNGKAFDENATYAVITHNANFNGMDSSYAMKEAAEANDKSAITTAVVRDVVWMYLSEELNNQVGTAYAAPAGRITLSGSQFADVSADAPYAAAVRWAVEKGVTQGTAAGLFSPDAICNRGQAMTFLWRAAGCPKSSAAAPRFTDVAPGSYCDEAVAWAVEQGITNGTTDTTFAPTATVSRMQVLTFLWRYAKAIGMDVSVGEETNILSYDDALSLPEYAIPAFQWACGAGVLAVEGAQLGGTLPSSRGEIVTFLFNCMNS